MKIDQRLVVRIKWIPPDEQLRVTICPNLHLHSSSARTLLLAFLGKRWTPLNSASTLASFSFFWINETLRFLESQTSYACWSEKKGTKERYVFFVHKYQRNDLLRTHPSRYTDCRCCPSLHLSLSFSVCTCLLCISTTASLTRIRQSRGEWEGIHLRSLPRLSHPLHTRWRGGCACEARVCCLCLHNTLSSNTWGMLTRIRWHRAHVPT